MSSTQASYHVPIINLPDEILLDILGLLHDEHETTARRTLDSRSTALAQQALHALTLTSRRLHVLTQPLVYRTVILAGTYKALYPRLPQSLHLAAYIRNLFFFQDEQHLMCETQRGWWDAVHEPWTGNLATMSGNLEHQLGTINCAYGAKLDCEISHSLMKTKRQCN
jgi:hypothetical protein